jgi:RNA polymerase sigma-70 factor (ECF subfamily)
MDRQEDLITRATQGDPVAVEALVAKHLPGLRAFIRLRAGKLIRARESCSDLVQSVAREALSDLADFEYRGEKAFRQWLYKRGLHKIINRAEYYRAEKRAAHREVRLESDDTEPGEALANAYASLATPSHEAVGGEAMRRLEEAMDELPEDYREAITLHRLVGLSQSEIAASMGRSEGAVRNLIYRGLARLTILMGEGDGQR